MASAADLVARIKASCREFDAKSTGRAERPGWDQTQLRSALAAQRAAYEREHEEVVTLRQRVAHLAEALGAEQSRREQAEHAVQPSSALRLSADTAHRAVQSEVRLSHQIEGLLRECGQKDTLIAALQRQVDDDQATIALLKRRTAPLSPSRLSPPPPPPRSPDDTELQHAAERVASLEEALLSLKAQQQLRIEALVAAHDGQVRLLEQRLEEREEELRGVRGGEERELRALVAARDERVRREVEQREEVERKLAELQEALSTKDELLEKRNAQVEKILEREEAAQMEVQRLHARFGELQERLEEELIRKEEELSIKEDEVARTGNMEEEVEELKRSIAVRDEKVEELKRSIAARDEEVEELRSLTESLKGALRRCELDLATRSEELEKVLSQKAQASDRKQAAQDALVADLRQQLVSAEEESSALREALHRRGEEARTAESKELERRDAFIDDLRGELAAKDESLATLRRRCDRMEQEVRSKDERIALLEGREREAQVELSSLRDTLASRERMIAERDERIVALNDRLSRGETEQEVGLLREKLMSREEEVARLEGMLADVTHVARQELESKEAELAVLNDALERGRSDLANARNSENAELRAIIAEQSAELEEKREAVARKCAEFADAQEALAREFEFLRVQVEIEWTARGTAILLGQIYNERVKGMLRQAAQAVEMDSPTEGIECLRAILDAHSPVFDQLTTYLDERPPSLPSSRDMPFLHHQLTALRQREAELTAVTSILTQ
eukprot:Sspe_Gene.45695::Locus_22689_Transcript_1_1_Confidence_1.000_Length_2355::g.45695::m.45695